MYVLFPVFHRTIWGGQKLRKYSEERLDQIGHMYIVNGHTEMSNKIANGAEKGKSLNQLFKEKKIEWNMDEYQEFPLTIALVDAAENLSIQVHPDDEIAEVLEGKKIGKKESWVFLDAPEEGWIYAGCNCDNREQIEDAIGRGEMESVTKHFPVKKMDYVCVQSGTLHAMTSGSLVYEIEYGSDYTYRFYDYERKDADGRERELHIEKALQAVSPGRIVRKTSVRESKWVSENEYEICLLNNIRGYRNTGQELECIAILDGEGTVEDIRLTAGMGIILLPGEIIENADLRRIVTARIRR